MTGLERRLHTVQTLFGIFILIGLSGCGLLGGNRMDCNPDLLMTLKIQAPASAKITSESCSSAINPTYRATFTLAPTDLDAFKQATQVTEWQTNASKAVFYKDKVSGMQSILFGQFGDGNYTEEVLIDTSNSQQYTVYFERAYVD